MFASGRVVKVKKPRRHRVMRKLWVGLLLSSLGLYLGAGSWAQNVGESGGSEAPIHFSRMYDLKTVATLSGEVTAVEQFSPGRGGPPQGLRLRVQFPQETLKVILGPIVYVEQQNAKFAAGDRVEVKGSRMTVRGEPLIVAAEVKKGDQVLKMRNANGEALWLAR
jgi:hypothetical protein